MLPGSLTRSRFIVGLAAVLWVGLLLATSITACRDPGQGIFDVYRDATTHWWAAEPLYRPGMRAFVYLTSGPLIFTPFAALGQPLDNLAWRIFSVAFFLWGMFRLVRRSAPVRRPAWRWQLILLLILPSAGVKTCSARPGRDWRWPGGCFSAPPMPPNNAEVKAALWPCLALALKPLALNLPAPAVRGSLPTPSPALGERCRSWCSLCRSCTRTRTAMATQEIAMVLAHWRHASTTLGTSRASMTSLMMFDRVWRLIFLRRWRMAVAGGGGRGCTGSDNSGGAARCWREPVRSSCWRSR
jgi:hypothetical protein